MGKNYTRHKSRSAPADQLKGCIRVSKMPCQCDTDKLYFGETDRHIGIRGSKHLDLEKSKYQLWEHTYKTVKEGSKN